VQHSTDREPRIRQNPRFIDRSGSSILDRHVNRPDVPRGEGGSSRRPKQTEEHIVMVGSWSCKVSSKIHINGQHISELVCEDMGKTMAVEPKGEKDPKRARVVLSKGHEVVRSGYSRLTGAAAKVRDRGEILANYSRVSKAKQHYPSRVSRVGWVTRVSQNSSTDRRIDRVSRVANMEIWVTENSPNMESRVTQNSANMEILVTQNSANIESRIMEDSANTENRVMQDSGGRKSEEWKGAAPSKRPTPW
jgi:hypothetical protein